MAQSQTVSGTVVDQSGAVIPGAQLKITDTAKGTVAREVATDATGRFQATNMQPGAYQISVEMTGFKTAALEFRLDVNSKLDIGQIKLEVGQVNDVRAQFWMSARQHLIHHQNQAKTALAE